MKHSYSLLALLLPLAAACAATAQQQSPAAAPAAAEQAAPLPPEQVADKLAEVMERMKRDGVLLAEDEFVYRWSAAPCNAASMYECLKLTRRGIMKPGDFPWIVSAMRLYDYRKDALLPMELLQLLLEAGADVNQPDEGGNPPLAYVGTDAALCRKLLEAGANPACTLKMKKASLLTLFLNDKAEEVLTMLLAAGADPNGADEDGNGLLHVAALYGSAAACRALLAAGANVNVCTNERSAEGEKSGRPVLTALDIALMNMRFEAARVLKEAGGETRNPKLTPLYLACFFGDEAELSKLIAAGADVHKPLTDTMTPLEMAAYAGHVNVCELLLKAGVAPESAKSDAEFTALHAAAVGNRAEVCKLLLAAGVPVDVRGNHGVTPLVLAAARGNVEIIEMLLAAGADANALTEQQTSPLAAAVRSGSVEAVRKLLAAGADPKAMVDDAPLLKSAVFYGNADICKALLEAGADVNAAASDGSTALHYAVQRECSADLFNLLLEAGANAAARNSDGETPLLMAISSRRDEACRILIAAKAAIDEPDKRGESPVLRVLYEGNVELCMQLIEAGAVLDDEDDAGQKLFDKAVSKAYSDLCLKLIEKGVKPKRWPELHLAALLGELDKVKTLIAQGNISINQQFKKHTALTYAAHMGHTDVCRELLAAGAYVNANEMNQWSPLLAAIDGRHADTCQALIDAGANVDAELKGGVPALIIAVQMQQPQIVRMLIDAGADVKDREPNESRTALHWAATLPGMGDVCDALIAAGLGVNSLAIYSRDTPLHCVVRSEAAGLRAPIARRLLAAGADKELKNKAGKTPVELESDQRWRSYTIVPSRVSF